MNHNRSDKHKVGDHPVFSVIEVEGNGKSLWVSGVSEDANPVNLKKLFSKYGKVLSVKIITTRSQNVNVFGHVTMSSSEEATACAEHVNQVEFNGRVLTIKKTNCELVPFKPSPDNVHSEKPGMRSVGGDCNLNIVSQEGGIPQKKDGEINLSEHKTNKNCTEANKNVSNVLNMPDGLRVMKEATKQIDCQVSKQKQNIENEKAKKNDVSEINAAIQANREICSDQVEVKKNSERIDANDKEDKINESKQKQENNERKKFEENQRGTNNDPRSRSHHHSDAMNKRYNYSSKNSRSRSPSRSGSSRSGSSRYSRSRSPSRSGSSRYSRSRSRSRSSSSRHSRSRSSSINRNLSKNQRYDRVTNRHSQADHFNYDKRNYNPNQRNYNPNQRNYNPNQRNHVVQHNITGNNGRSLERQYRSHEPYPRRGPRRIHNRGVNQNARYFY